MKKYKVIRIDMETYNNVLDKQSKISKVVNSATGTNKIVPFTKVLKICSASPIFYMGRKDLLKMGEIK